MKIKLFFNCSCGVACVFTPTLHKSFVFWAVQELGQSSVKMRLGADFGQWTDLKVGVN